MRCTWTNSSDGRISAPRFGGRPARQRGTVLIVALGVLTMLSVMGTTFALMMQTERAAAYQYMLGFIAETLAHDGIEHAVVNLQAITSGEYPSFEASSLNYFSRLDPLVHFGTIFIPGAGGVPDTYSYRDHSVAWNESGDYVHFGSSSITELSIPVAFPYSLVDTTTGLPFVDITGSGTYDAEADVLLEELYPSSQPGYKAVFFDEETDQVVFSGFTHEGRYHSFAGQPAGTRTPGGNRFRLKVVPTNAQLSLNFIGRTLYDRFVYDEEGEPVNGTAFKFMLHLLGYAIAREHPELCMGPGGILVNPFSREVVDELWAIRSQLGSETYGFTSKDPVRDVIERHTHATRAWQAVKEYITVHAWPGEDPVRAAMSPNTFVPSNGVEAYRRKVGYRRTGTSTTGQNSLMPNPNGMPLNPATLPPVDVNTAPFAVLYATVANLAGDSRFYYYSRERLTMEEENLIANPIIDAAVDGMERTQRYFRGDLPDLAEEDNFAEDGGYQFWYNIADNMLLPERRIFRKNWQLQRNESVQPTQTASAPFDRTLGILHQVRISPFNASMDAAEDPTSSGEGYDFAWSLAKAIEYERDQQPFRSWADFDHRFIQRYIVEDRGQYQGEQVCLPFESSAFGVWEHPMNPNSIGGSRDPEWLQREAELRHWYYHSVADLMRAALQPAPKTNTFNPDAAYYQRIARDDLVYWTVPFTFQTKGIYEVTSVGEVLGELFDPVLGGYTLRPIAQRQFRAIVRLADTVRHHTQADFNSGVPPRRGAFQTNADADIEADQAVRSVDAERYYSSVRLTAFSGYQRSTQLYPPPLTSEGGVSIVDVSLGEPDRARLSSTATYPYPMNQDVRFMRVRGHEVPMDRAFPEDMEETVYYTGFRQADLTPRLHGPIEIDPNASGASRPGYVALRPQDTSPFDPEMRIDASTNRYLGREPMSASFIDIGTGLLRPDQDHLQWNGETPEGLLLQNLQAGEPDEARYLLFWMPFNETIDTASSVNQGGATRGFGMRYGGHQTAVIPSIADHYLEPYEQEHVNAGRWGPDGFNFRAFDRGTPPHFTNSFAFRFTRQNQTARTAEEFESNSFGIINMGTVYRTGAFSDPPSGQSRPVVKFPMSLRYPAGLNFEPMYTGQRYESGPVPDEESTIVVQHIIRRMIEDYAKFDGTVFNRSSGSGGESVEGGGLISMIHPDPNYLYESEEYQGSEVDFLHEDPDRDVNQAQHLFQTRTNFPHYHGTVEFWFKSDVDQWDMLVTAGNARPTSALPLDQSQYDAFLGGFLAATTILQRRAEGTTVADNRGIQGVQTFFYREMGNTLVVSRVYFLEAIRDDYNSTTVGTWAGSGGGGTHPLLDWLYQRSDIVTNEHFLNNPWDPVDPEMEWDDPVGPEADAAMRHPVELDPFDYGFLYSRYDAWVKLDSLWEGGAGLLWRPHEWYHLAFSFRSDAGTYTSGTTVGTGNQTLQPGISGAIDFYINGVWVDSDSPAGYLSATDSSGQPFYPSSLDPRYGRRNWPSWYLIEPETGDTDDYINDGAELPATGVTSPFLGGLTGEFDRQRRKWGSTLNELSPEPRLVIGAVTRRQATDEQIQGTGSGLSKEMFWFADGEFYAPANGTIDSLRITNKYLSIERGNPSYAIAERFTQGGAFDRIRQFARYNTRFTEDVTAQTGGLDLELGYYENAFANTWGSDVLIANIVWNEYRPTWDSAFSDYFEFNEAPSVAMQFRVYNPEVVGTENRRTMADLHEERVSSEDVANPINNGYRALQTPDGIVGSGVAFPTTVEPLVLPRDGMMVYLAIFNKATVPEFIANSTPVFDEISMTVMIPREILALNEVFDR